MKKGTDLAEIDINIISSGILPVSEMFLTVQGEATNTGRRAFFVRLQGCPVGCSFCDTKYTWDLLYKDQAVSFDPENELWVQFDKDSIVSEVQSRMVTGLVVFSGGEPAMFDLTAVTSNLIELGYDVQIETSGTYEVRCHPNTWVTLSPKLNNRAGMPILSQVVNRANEFKFPIGKRTDVALMFETLREWGRFDLPIWLQPLSQSKKATELCLKTIYETDLDMRISVQTHKYIGVE